MVILQKNPLSAVLFLVLTFFCLAALFVLLSAPFIAALQVIVYAGAILVLFLFVIMLLNLKGQSERGIPALKVVGVVVAGLFLIVTAVLLRTINLPPDSSFAQPGPQLGSVESVGLTLFSEYLLPLEIVSFLLLAGIIGAVVLVRKKND